MMRFVAILVIANIVTLQLQAAQPFTVGPLPESPYVDTEVATNVPFAIGWRDVVPAWDLLKVIRRGPPAESSTVALTVESGKFALILR